MKTWLPRFLAALLVLGGLCYSAWLVAPLCRSRLSTRDSYVSELAATGEPTAVLTRSLDLTFAVLLLVVCVIALHRGRRRGPGAAGDSPVLDPEVANRVRGVPWLHAGVSRLVTLGWLVWWGGLVAVALATMVDVAAPLSCPISQASCPTPTGEGLLAARRVHEVVSVVVGVGWVAAQLGAFTHTWLPAHGRRLWPVTRVLTPPVLGLSVVYGLAAGPLDHLGRWHGAAQRLHLLALLVWFLGIAVDLWRHRHPRLVA